MAQPELALPTNVDGEFFVDSSCIDCDACRQIAPATFDAVGDQSAVVRQPLSDAERLAAGQALLSCPTASIGTRGKHDLREAVASLPKNIDGPVFFCGYTAESSFGAWSYLVVRPGGNLLVDSPRFNLPLVRNIEKLGGVSQIALTHRDDVADHAKFASHFATLRVLHQRDVSRATADVEWQPRGEEPLEIAPGVTMFPTPGHTSGHAVYLVDRKYLFTGDHLAWSPRRGHLVAFRNACWYSWSEQIKSMERLLDVPFEWVLPGHGRMRRLAPGTSRAELERCIDWMRR